jgi:drug/metabolite transporter (DMT)-like permease
MKFTSVANGSLIANTSPIFVALGAWLLLGERFTRIFLAGLALSILGVAVLMSRSVSLGGELLLGDLLAVIASLLWGAYMLAVQRLRRRFTTATIMTWTAVVSAALLLVAALAAGESLIPRTLAGWEAILGLALVSHAGGQSLVAYALAQLPASFSSVGLLIQPVYATIAAWITLGETPGPLQAIGGAIVLAGIVVARRGSR